MVLAEHGIADLYAPQFEQFGTKLDMGGSVWTTVFENEIGSGNAWVMPLGGSCLVMEHNVTPRRDMLLSEFTPLPYACAASINQPTLGCMPQSGITPCNVIAEAREAQMSKSICTFLQGTCGESISPLKAGVLYHSRSVIFLPGYFEELDKQYPSEFAGMFGLFGARVWNDAAAPCIADALDQLDPSRARTRGSLLYAQATVEKMVAELAFLTSEMQDARCAAGCSDNARLARQAAALVEKSVACGRRVGIEELAAQLYTSRSRLCAVFKEETGETVAAYARRLRLERAEHLLARDNESIATVARKLGYAHQAAFTQAFKQAHGITPSVWRQLHA